MLEQYRKGTIQGLNKSMSNKMTERIPRKRAKTG